MGPSPTCGTTVAPLPAEAYFTDAWHDLEQQALYSSTWVFVGHVSQLPTPGACLTADVGAEPVVVVRGADGELRGFLNVCRHRGMPVVGAGGLGAAGEVGPHLRCPYHGWEWTLEGALTRVPQRSRQFPGLVVADLGLHPVAVGTWCGFVFVHLSPRTAEPITEWMAPLAGHTGDYAWNVLVEVARHVTDLECNWKLFIENHVDWLHLWYLHGESLQMYDHHGAVFGPAGVHWWSREELHEGREPHRPAGVLPVPGLSEVETRTLRANLVFPNLPVVTTGSLVRTSQVVPTGPTSCRLELRYYAAPGSTMSDEVLAQALRIPRDEDARACERLQRAVRSRAFAPGPLAVEHEAAVVDFHRSVLAAVGGGPG